MKDKLAIIVPYRDRQEHLDVFVPHIHEFLKDKGIDYTILLPNKPMIDLSTMVNYVM